MEEKEKAARAEKLALEILDMSRTKLMVNMRFLDMALSRLPPRPEPRPDLTSSAATDGSSCIFAPKHILSAFLVEENMVTRDYLHMLFHCVFRHPFVDPLVDSGLWDIACDIAVESAINDLGLDYLRTLKSERQTRFIEGYKGEIRSLTAEKLYRFLSDKRLPQRSLDALRMLFKADDHVLWYLNDGEKAALGVGGGSSFPENSAAPRQGSAEEEWKRVGEQMQIDLEMFGSRRGTQAGLLTQELRELNRERYDYADFLKKFAVSGEIMKINPDEFDYNFYTYGLTLYDNMPLIEPLEYTETKAVREFVIAIDTSGSTSGELVERFVRKTFNILKSSESFFSKVNIHIIQCDAAIQEDVKLTTREEFEEYLKAMTIRGLGGTDFRPVFSYVNSLVEIGELAGLKGMIYFTDGVGAFPAQMPDYKAAFVFLNDGVSSYKVPPWAMKLVLDEDEI